MKAFQFHLEQVRRWRGAQLILQKAKVSKAAGIAANIQAQLESTTEAVRESTVQIREESSGQILSGHADFTHRADRQIRELQKHRQDAARVVSVEMNLLIQARRKLQLMDDLKETERTQWQKAFDKETAEFMDDSHLAKLNQLQSRKRTGA